MTNTRITRLLTFALACSFGGGSAAAQLDEADRLQRCQGNRNAIATAQNELLVSGYMTDEQLGRARAAYATIQRERENQSKAATDFTLSGRTDQRAVERYNRAIAAQRAAAASVNAFCLSTGNATADERCIMGLQATVANLIDLAVRVRESSQPTLQRIARFQSNMIALRCGQEANPAKPR